MYLLEDSLKFFGVVFLVFIFYFGGVYSENVRMKKLVKENKVILVEEKIYLCSEKRVKNE